jgi:HEAT repeat protein
VASRAYLQALARIESLEEDRNFPGLIRELDNLLGAGRVTIAGEAARALGRIGDPRAVEYLAPLVEHSSSDLREGAAIALGDIGDRSAAPALIRALDDPSMVVRGLAAKSLGRIGASESVERLYRVSTGDVNPWVRLYAAEALALLRREVAIELAESALAREPRWQWSARGRRARWRRLLAEDEPVPSDAERGRGAARAVPGK